MSFPQLCKADVLGALDIVELEKANQVIAILAKARDDESRIFAGGNGATSSYLVCDTVKGANFNHDKRFRIMSYSNDAHFGYFFVERLENLPEPGDVPMAISGSGNLHNMLRAIESANSIDCRTVALSSHDGGGLSWLAQLNTQATKPHMSGIKDALVHMSCFYFMDAEMLAVTETRAQ